MAKAQINFGELGGGGIDLANAVYAEYNWTGNQPMNLPTPNGKAKALIGYMPSNYCFFVVDGMNDNCAMENGVKNTNRTYTFNDSTVTSTSSMSSSNMLFKFYIIY